MVFIAKSVGTYAIPHVFYRMDKETKSIYKKKYTAMKRLGLILNDGAVLIVEILKSKIKTHSYKILLAVFLGPFIQVASLPVYVFTYSRKVALWIHEFGGKIVKGEFGFLNMMFVLLDLTLFGEPVSINENQEFCMIRNETESIILELVENVSRVYDKIG